MKRESAAGAVQVISARFIVPIRPAGVVLEQHCVVVQGDRIQSVMPREQARQQYPAADFINLGQHVLLPGLINMHTHSPMTLLRGYADDLDLHAWLNDHIWPAESRHVSAEFVADGTRIAVAEMLRAGTTCFNDNYFFPDVMADVAVATGMRAVIGLPVIELPTAWAADTEEYLRKGVELLERWQGHDRVSFSWAPHAPYSVSDKTLMQLRELSRQYDVPIHMHLLETCWDLQHSMEHHGEEPLARLDRLDVLNQRLLAVHMTQLSAADIELLADRGVNVIHCPQSNLKLASGFCRVADLQRAGVNIAIGTDGVASNNNLDLLAEAQTAALLAKGVARDASVVTAFSALEMITINAATALGQGDRLGSLEAGKLADLVALDLDVVETQPLYNVISQLVYAASSSQFTDVWVAGNRVMESSNLTTLQLDQILATAAKWQQRLAAPVDQPTVSSRTKHAH